MMTALDDSSVKICIPEVLHVVFSGVFLFITAPLNRLVSDVEQF